MFYAHLFQMYRMLCILLQIFQQNSLHLIADFPTAVPWCFLSQHHKVLESLLITNFMYVYTVLIHKFLIEAHHIELFSFLFCVLVSDILCVWVTEYGSAL